MNSQQTCHNRWHVRQIVAYLAGVQSVNSGRQQSTCHGKFSNWTHSPTSKHWILQRSLGWSKSNLLYDSRSVSQYVLVSSPLWDLRPDITSCLKFAVFFLWSALSDDRTEGRSGSYFMTHGQSVSMSWYRAPLWDLRPDITSCRNVVVWNLQSCFYGAPSLTTGRKEVEEVTLWLTVSPSVCLGIEHPCGTCDQILVPVITSLSEICGLVSVGRPIWREDWSAVCSAITQRSESLRTRNYTLLSHLRLPQPGGPGSRIYIPQEEGGPVIPPGTGFTLRRLLRLAGLRRRYSSPPPPDISLCLCNPHVH
jgi:hypothetical protein